MAIFTRRLEKKNPKYLVSLAAQSVQFPGKKTFMGSMFKIKSKLKLGVKMRVE